MWLKVHTCDVILDSGADTSALPLRFGTAGTECPSPSTSYVDAQGMPLAIASTRLAHVQFGDVVFKEKFIVSDILHLEQYLCCGWSIVHEGGPPFLVKDDKRIEILYRNNSLCARGQISVVSQVEPCLEFQPAVRVVQLGMVLRNLADGWNRIHPHLFAIKRKLPKHVDSTCAPSEELMWLRTTLVLQGRHWLGS